MAEREFSWEIVDAFADELSVRFTKPDFDRVSGARAVGPRQWTRTQGG